MKSERADTISLERCGVSWEVVQGYEQDVIFASDLGWRKGEIVRATPGRRVMIVRGKRCPLVVKHFYGGFARDLKAVFRGSPAAREWQALHEAQIRGLPIPQPVAVGARQGLLGRESFLVTEALEGSDRVANYLFAGDRASAPERWNVIKSVAEMLRRAHDIGFYQRDLHLRNILVRITGDRREIFFIDLQRSSNLFPLDESRRWRNLAVLHGGCIEASRTDRLRFLKHYLTCPVPLPVDLRELVVQLQRKGLRYRLNLWRSRQKRCLAENRDFVRVEAGLFSGFARRDAWEPYLKDLLRQPEGLLQRAAIQVVKDSKATTVGVADGVGVKLYIKRYNYQGIPYAIKDLFRSSRARRTWVAANSLHMRDIPVALPLAYLEKRRCGILLESYFVTEAVTGTNLRQTFNRYDETGAGQKEKRALVHAVARVVKKMHANGVSHRDLKANNIVARERAPEQFDLFIVDFDGIRIGAVSWRRRAKDLTRLVRETQRHSCFSMSDRVRFLKTYLGWKEKEWKTAWASMAKKR